VDNFFTELCNSHAPGNFLVVAHNGVNRLYMAYKLGMPLKNYRQLVQLNSAVTLFTLDAQGIFTLQYLNSKL
jgi:alpha-ribazole phosphatase/probable phosphoglycerate mutase